MTLALLLAAGAWPAGPAWTGPVSTGADGPGGAAVSGRSTGAVPVRSAIAGEADRALPADVLPADAPRRVVSINLCTDQLALMLAAPGQLASVTAFAQDPRQSPLSAEAAALPANHARAEEVYLLRPDLVLASDFTAPATLAMLRRLDLRVETFPAAQSLANVDAAISQMGALLGRGEAAAAMQARFREDLADLRRDEARRQGISAASADRTVFQALPGQHPAREAGEMATAASVSRQPDTAPAGRPAIRQQDRAASVAAADREGPHPADQESEGTPAADASAALGGMNDLRHRLPGPDPSAAPPRPVPLPPRAAIFEANGYTPGPRSLAGEIVAAAGFRDVAAEAGLDYGGMIPLEQLVTLAPDAVISPRPPVGTSRGDELAAHPAVRQLRAQGIAVPRMDSDWSCGTPLVLKAVRGLAEARKAAQKGSRTGAGARLDPAPADRPTAQALMDATQDPAAADMARGDGSAPPAPGRSVPQAADSPDQR